MHAWHRRHHWSYRRNADEAARRRARSRGFDQAQLDRVVRDKIRAGRAQDLTVFELQHASTLEGLDGGLVRNLLTSLYGASLEGNWFPRHQSATECPRGHPADGGYNFTLLSAEDRMHRINEIDSDSITAEGYAEDSSTLRFIPDRLACDGCAAEWPVPTKWRFDWA